jgi:hypothetical protein
VGEEGEVALLRLGERLWRCTEPPRNATQGTGWEAGVNSKSPCAVWRWTKLIFAPNKSLHQKSLCLSPCSARIKGGHGTSQAQPPGLGS